eukprot:COSAG02_NODE_6919_length_3288_cov_10.744434_2_plen_156_part_00
MRGCVSHWLDVPGTETTLSLRSYHHNFRCVTVRATGSTMAIVLKMTTICMHAWIHGQVFNAGHCIRITVSCTGLPLYETAGSGHSPGGGPQHGDVTPGTAEKIGRVVHEILCGGSGGVRASHVLAPVIPANGDRSRCVDMSGAIVADLARGHFPG